MAQVFKLSADDRQITVDLGATGLSIPAMALEILGLGDTAFTSVSTPDIQELGSNLYQITFTEAQVNQPAFLLFSLTGAGFNPFIGILFTLTDQDLIAGVPPSKISSLPVVAFNGTTPVTGLAFGDLDTFFQRSNETGESNKTLIAADVVEPLNEFSVARGVYLIKFLATDLNKIGDFDYRITQGGATPFDDFSLTVQVAQSPPTRVTIELRDSSPELTTPTDVPTTTDLVKYIGSDNPVNRLSFRFSQFGQGYVGLQFEYHNGTAFTTLTVADGTLLFTQNGDVTWTLPGDQSIGGPGAPNTDDYFIKILATAVASSAEVEQLDADTFVEGVTVSVLDSDGVVAATGVTSDLGQLIADLVPDTYTVILQKAPNIFNFNNVELVVFDDEGLQAQGTTDQTQKVILEGAFQQLADPAVDPNMVTLKTDLVNLTGDPVQRQQIRLEHKFLPTTFGGSKTLLGRTVPIITDDRGHAEIQVVAAAQLDVFLTNTLISRQIVVPAPRSGTGDSVDPAPTVRFKSDGTEFVAADLQGIITIAGVDHVITKVVDTSELEVSPAIASDLVGAAWSIKKIDIFSLISVAPDQFSVAIAPIDDFAVRTSLP